MIIATCNINGLRGSLLTGKGARSGSGLDSWFLPLKNKSKIDVLCLQETRITKDNKLFNDCLKKCEIDDKDFILLPDENNTGHGGVAIWVNPEKFEIQEIRTPFENINESKENCFSGRWLEVDVKNKKTSQNVCVVSAYFHHADSPTVKLANGNLIDRKKSETTMNNKHIFMDSLTKRLRTLQKRAESEHIEVVVAGDFNIAHTNLDIKNYSGNRTKAGFLPEERAWLSLWFQKNWEDGLDFDLKSLKKTYSKNTDFNYSTPKTDQFDEKNGGDLEYFDICREKWGENRIYTWWTNMGRAFDNDAGWRIDYQITTKQLAKKVINARVDRQSSFTSRFSDHAPLIVEYGE